MADRTLLRGIVFFSLLLLVGIFLYQSGDIVEEMYARSVESKDRRLGDQRAMLAALVGVRAIVNGVLAIPEVQKNESLAKALGSDAAAIHQITSTFGAAIRQDSQLPKLYLGYFLKAVGALLAGMLLLSLASTALDISSPHQHFEYKEAPGGHIARFLRFAQYSMVVMTSFATTDVQPVGWLARVLALFASGAGLFFVSGIIAISVSILVD